MNSGQFRLVAGLGNPGKKYSNNRHNVGFMALDQFANKKGIRFQEKNKLFGELATLTSNQKSIKLLKPNTFMNDSGRSIRASLDWYGLNMSQLIVLVDDMDIPLGRLRIRSQGSSGGHNGLKSTINHLGSQDFYRLRIGIGSPSEIKEERKSKTISHVLGSFNPSESKILVQIIEEVLFCIDLFDQQNLEKICTRINSFKPDLNKIK